MKPFIALILIAGSAFHISASAQKHPNSAAASPAAAVALDATRACPSATAMEQPHLLGVWHAQLPAVPAVPGTPAVPGQPASHAVLYLHQHPELAGSVRGTVQRGGSTAQVTGDVHQGELTLEESTDGVRISATWLGDVVENSCGKEIHGIWNTNTPELTTPFVLRKQATGQ